MDHVFSTKLTGLLNHFKRFVTVKGKLLFTIKVQRRRGQSQSLTVILGQSFIISPIAPNPVL